MMDGIAASRRAKRDRRSNNLEGNSKQRRGNTRATVSPNVLPARSELEQRLEKAAWKLREHNRRISQGDMIVFRAIRASGWTWMIVKGWLADRRKEIASLDVSPSLKKKMILEHQSREWAIRHCK